MSAADSRSLLALRRSRKLRRFSSSGMAGMRNCELLSLEHMTVTKECSSKPVSKLGRGRVGELRQDPAVVGSTRLKGGAVRLEFGFSMWLMRDRSKFLPLPGLLSSAFAYE